MRILQRASLLDEHPKRVLQLRQKEDKMKIIIGIDNGVSGGLAAVTETSFLLSMIAMPIQKARKGNEIDAKAVWQWISDMDISYDKLTVIIEEPGGSKSAKAATSMAGSFHCLRTICEIKGIRWHRITPQIWQKDLLPGCKSGDTKPRALAAVKALWPGESFLATECSKVAHEGLVDAALIAEYARRKNL